MTLDSDGRDEVIGMIAVPKETEETILVISEQGYGKRSVIDDYRITNRGTKGVKTLNITDKTGELVAIRPVTDEHDLMIINKSGITIRVHARDISVQGRATQGVRIIDLKKRGDEIASVCQVLSEDEEEEPVVDGEGLETASHPEGVDTPDGETTTNEQQPDSLFEKLIDRALEDADNQ